MTRALANFSLPSEHQAPLRLGILAVGGLGGSSRVAWDLARGLAQAGHHVVVLSAAGSPWQPPLGPPIELVHLRGPRVPRPAEPDWVHALAEDLRTAVERHRLELLSVHYATGLANAAVEARDRLAAAGRPRPAVCVTLHGTDVSAARHDPEQRRVVLEACSAADHVTAVSERLADMAHRELGFPRRPTVIGNAIDRDLFHPAPGLASLERPRLAFASNFRPIKRPADPVRVLAGLTAAGIDAHLTMFGEGPLLAETQVLVHRLGLGRRVDFPGIVPAPALARALREFALALVTSEFESFSLIALEAMASGVPVVGTRCGGLEELMGRDPSAGLPEALLADAGDIEGLTARAAALLRSPPHHAGIRARCLELAERGASLFEQRDAYASLFVALRPRAVP